MRLLNINEDPPEFILDVPWTKIKKLIAQAKKCCQQYFDFNIVLETLNVDPCKSFQIMSELYKKDLIGVSLNPKWRYADDYISTLLNREIPKDATKQRIEKYLQKSQVENFYITPKSYKMAQRRIKRATLETHLKNCFLKLADLCEQAAKYGGWNVVRAKCLNNECSWDIDLAPSDIILFGSFLDEKRKWLGDIDLAIIIGSNNKHDSSFYYDLLKKYIRKHKISFISIKKYNEIKFMFDGTDLGEGIQPHRIILDRNSAIQMPDLGASRLREIASDLSLIFTIPDSSIELNKAWVIEKEKRKKEFQPTYVTKKLEM
jgi:hypothetical protein